MISIIDVIETNDYSSAPGIFGLLGVTAAIVFSNFGSAYGTAKSGVGIASVGVMKPEILVKTSKLNVKNISLDELLKRLTTHFQV